MISMKQLEANLYSVEARKQLFSSLGVPKHLMDSFVYRTEVIYDIQEKPRFFRSIRQFSTLPRWLKKRIKYRLNHADNTEFIDFTAMVDYLVN